MTLYTIISIAVWSIMGLGVLAVLADYVTRRRGIVVLPHERRCVTGLFSDDAEMHQHALDDFMVLRPHWRERVLAHLFNKAQMDTPEGYRALSALGEALGLVRESPWIHQMVALLRDESRRVKQRCEIARALGKVDNIDVGIGLNGVLLAKSSDRALLETVQQSLILLGGRGVRHFPRALHNHDLFRVQLAAEGIAQLTEWIERENLKASAELSLRAAVQRLERTTANDSETTATLDALHHALQAIGAETGEQPTLLPQAA